MSLNIYWKILPVITIYLWLGYQGLILHMVITIYGFHVDFLISSLNPSIFLESKVKEKKEWLFGSLGNDVHSSPKKKIFDGPQLDRHRSSFARCVKHYERDEYFGSNSGRILPFINITYASDMINV